jgi:hypothetical protein
MSAFLTVATAYGLWPTPTGVDGKRGTGTYRPPDTGIPLPQAIAMWATPVANDDNKSPAAHVAMKRRMKGGPRNTITSLQVQVKAWGTPTSRDYKDSGNCSNVPVNGLLGREAKSWSGMTEQRGSLNPEFHLWLMGFPRGFNVCEPPATPSSRRSPK